MIDIHTHLIPNFDDGSKSLEMTKKMLDEHVRIGINTIYLTPHQNANNKNKLELVERFEKLKEELKDYPINFYLGSEIYYYNGLIDDLKNDRCLTMNNTKYVLVEFSTRTETNIADIIYEIVIAGFKPIVAHIERYQYLSENDYLEIKSNGALIQVNSKSFENKEYKKILKFLLKNKLIDFIASDCHNDTNRNVDFTEAIKIISKKYKDQFDHIFNNELLNN